MRATPCSCGARACKKEARRRTEGRGPRSDASPVNSTTTPARDSRGREASHGLPRRARGARGGGGAQGEMERSMVSWSGRNGQLRRGAGAGGAGGERVHCCCCCCPSEKQKRWRRGRQTRRGDCRRDRRGAGTIGVHAVSDDDGVRTRGRRALRLGAARRGAPERTAGSEAGRAGLCCRAKKEAAAR